MKIVTPQIVHNITITANYFLIKIKSMYLAEHSVPGQFVMVKLQDNTTDPLLRIPLGVHSINKDGISLLYRVIGQGTEILSQKQSGENLNILGPLGNGFNITEQQNNILVAGGCGVAPLYALAELLTKQNKTVTLFLGAATKDEIVCAEKFAALGVKVEIATEDGSEGFNGLVTELVKQNLHNDNMIYASGPNPMLKALTKLSTQLNIPAQLSLEAYMACGIGVCRGCAIETQDGYKMCCQDGPVFSAEILT